MAVGRRGRGCGFRECLHFLDADAWRIRGAPGRALSQTPDDTPRLCRLVLLATAGNTLGAMTTWLIGRLIPEREKTDRALVWLRRWGAPALLLSWLPVVGDALPLAAGWLRMPAASCAVWVAVGKLLRYVVVAAGTLSLV